MQSLYLCAESIGGIQWWASQSRYVASVAGSASLGATLSVVVACVVAAAVGAAAATAGILVSCMDLLHMDIYVYFDLDLYRLVWTCMACGCGWTSLFAFLDNFDYIKCLWCVLWYMWAVCADWGAMTEQNRENMLSLPCARAMAHGKEGIYAKLEPFFPWNISAKVISLWARVNMHTNFTL